MTIQTLEAMEKADLNQVSAVLSAKIPYQLKMFYIEQAMMYKMTLNQYMNILLNQIMRNEDLLNPEKVKQMVDSVGEVSELKKQLSEKEKDTIALQAGWNKAIAELEKKQKAWTLAEKRAEALESDKESLISHYEKKRKGISEANRKRLTEAEKVLQSKENKIKELEGRLAKANKRLKDENIGTGMFNEKPAVQY